MKLNRCVKILFLFCIITFGLWKVFSWRSDTEQNTKNRPYLEYSQYLDEVEKNFAFRMRKELGLILSGGGGRMHDKIEEIRLKFTAYRRAKKEEARALHSFVLQQFLVDLNNNEKLKLFLEEYPFTHERITLSISFNNKNQQYAEGGVSCVNNVSGLAERVENRNRLFYKTIDPFSGNIIRLQSESHEEAVQRALEHPIQNIAVHEVTPLEEAIDELFPAFTEQMWDQFKCECNYIGGKMTGMVEEVGVKFTLRKRTTQEEARELVIVATEKLLDAINQSEKLRPYLIEFPYPSCRLKVRICFRKNNYYSYDDGSMESVTLVGDEITYFQELPPGRTSYPVAVPVFATESYQEAEQINTVTR